MGLQTAFQGLRRVLRSNPKRGTHRQRRGSTSFCNEARRWFPAQTFKVGGRITLPGGQTGTIKKLVRNLVRGAVEGGRRALRPSVKVASGTQCGTGVSWGDYACSPKGHQKRKRRRSQPRKRVSTLGESPTIEPKATESAKASEEQAIPKPSRKQRPEK